MKNLKRLAILCVLLTVSFGLFANGTADTGGAMTTEGTGVYYNPDAPLSDLRVRQAIAYAIDMDTLAETVLEGMAIVADSNVPNGSWKVDGLDPFSYDPDKARELLKAANWDSSIELDLVFYYSDQGTIDLMTAIQSYLADVGIKMTFRKLEGDIGAQLNAPPDDPVAGPANIVWDLGYGARAALALQEYYNGYRTGESARIPGNAELDTLIDNINNTPDVEKQREGFFAIEKWANEQMPALPLYYQQLYIYESNRVNRNGHGYGNEQYVWDWGIIDWTVPVVDGKQSLYTNTGPIEAFQSPWSNPGIWMPNKVLWGRLLSCDGSLSPNGVELAESYDLSADGLSLSIKMRDGQTWHDGSPLTAEDVQFSIEFFMSQPLGHKVFRTTFSSLEGFEAFESGAADSISGITVTGNTIDLKFAKLDPNVLLCLTQFAILPKKHLGDADPMTYLQDSFWQYPIGSGPFKIGEVAMNDFLVMVPFENWYDGVAKLDEIVCYPSFENDANVLKNAAAGKLDYGFTKAVADVKGLRGMDNMRVVPADIPYTRFLWFNMFPKK